MDVIYYFETLEAKQQAIWQLFTIDQDLTILNTHFDEEGNIDKLDNWNERWRVSTQAPGVEMHATRMPMATFDKIIDANISGFTILAAGYPGDDIEQMLRNGKTAFAHTVINEAGEAVEQEVDLSLTDNEGNKLDHRINPTEATCKLYNELYPSTFITQDPEGNDVTIARGNFARHGLNK